MYHRLREKHKLSPKKTKSGQNGKTGRFCSVSETDNNTKFWQFL